MIGADRFGDVVDTHLPLLRAYFRSRLSDWSAADDLAQDVFVTAFAKREEFREGHPVECWLVGIARNHLRNFFRKQREEPGGIGEELEAMMDRKSESWHLHTETNDRLYKLRQCLERLPEGARKLLEARYVESFSIRELSAKSGKGYSALSMQIHRLREILYECIKKKSIHEEP